MPHIAEANLDVCGIGVLRKGHLAMHFPQVNPSGYHHWTSDGGLEREIMEIEAQSLRNGAEDMQFLAEGHGTML